MQEGQQGRLPRGVQCGVNAKVLVQPAVNVRHLRAKFMYSVGQSRVQELNRREREGGVEEGEAVA